jgi:hypothetical protein
MRRPLPAYTVMMPLNILKESDSAPVDTTVGVGWVYSGRLGGMPYCRAVHFIRDGGERTVCGLEVRHYWETDCIDLSEFTECFENYHDKCRRGILLHPELIRCVSLSSIISQAATAENKG